MTEKDRREGAKERREGDRPTRLRRRHVSGLTCLPRCSSSSFVLPPFGIPMSLAGICPRRICRTLRTSLTRPTWKILSAAGRVDGGGGLHPVRARGRQDAHFLVWHDYFRRKQRSRRKTKHRTNAIISIHEGRGASQTDGCISVSISGKPPLMHQRGGFTTLREATVHAMKDELRPFQRVGMNLSERNGTAQPLIRR